MPRHCYTSLKMAKMPCSKLYLRPVSYAMLFIALMTTMVALCSSNWYSVVVNGSQKKYFGIWNVCEKPDVTSKCDFLPNDYENKTKDWLHPDSLTSVRGSYAMTILFLFGALGYPPFFKQMSNGVLKIEFMALLATVGGTMSMAAMLIMSHAIHTTHAIPPSANKEVFTSDPVNGYSYYIGWTATGLTYLSGILIYLASKDNVVQEGSY